MAGGIRIKNIGCNDKKFPAEVFVALFPKYLLFHFLAYKKISYIHFKILLCNVQKAYNIYTSSHNCFHST